MEDLKDYLKHSLINLRDYFKKTEAKHVKTVINEKERPEDAVRIWVSFDFNKTDGKEYYVNVDKWSKDKEIQAEMWGNSVRTFLWKGIKEEPTIESIAKYLVEKFIKYEILDGEKFEDNKWQKTKDTSIYVFYRYKVKITKNEKTEIMRNSNHFVLVLNAEIPHLDYFDEDSEDQQAKREQIINVRAEYNKINNNIN